MLEDAMGYERPSKTPLHADAQPTVVRDGRAICADSEAPVVASRPETIRGETDVWRQARQMRDEWRRNRYSRLRLN
jgi:hypothetical protein